MDLLKWFRPKQRALTYDQFAQGIWKTLGISNAGIPVTEASAMSLPALWCGVTNLSATCASLPLEFYDYNPDGSKELNPDHFGWKLFNRKPNSFMGAYTFRKTMTALRLLHGNAFAEIVRKGNGQVESLMPIHPSRVQVKINDDQLLYIIDGDRTVSENNMFHLMGLSLSGLIGEQTILQAREALGVCLATDRFTGAFFRNGARLSGYLSSDKAVSPEARVNLEKSWALGNTGIENAGNVPLLEENIKFNPLTFNAKDASLNESRIQNDKVIAQVLNIPLVFVKSLERATWANYTQEMEFFVQFSLRDHVIGWEEEIHRKIIMPSEEGKIFAEHSVDHLLRGNTVERYTAYNLAILGGWLTKDEVRQMEHMAPLIDEEPTVMDSQDIPAIPETPQQEKNDSESEQA